MLFRSGSPSQASAAEGAELFAWMVEDLTALVRRGLTETPPLPHSYDGPAVPMPGA